MISKLFYKNKTFAFLTPLVVGFSGLLASCSSFHSVGKNVLLQSSVPEDAITSDSIFLSRQQKAVGDFFGFSSSQNDELLDDANINSEDIANLEPDSSNHSLVDNTDPSTASTFAAHQIFWPTNGKLSSLFGIRTIGHRTKMHTGIDISAPTGTPIHASAEGQVLFTGTKRGYGKSVIIGHDFAHETLYAHMNTIIARNGQYVQKNQIIGYVGKTGHVTGANLHFETRISGVPYNPLTFLPPDSNGHGVKVGMGTPNSQEQLTYYQNKSRLANQSR